jgi:PAS domain S-box-containing protein
MRRTKPSVPGVHRGVFRRRHHEQHSGRHHSELESRRGAALRIPCGGGGRQASLHPGPGDQRASLKWISDRLARGENVGQFEGVGLTKDGKRVNISISACPMRNADGQITARAAIMRDITARVQAQEARACWLPSWIPPTTPSSAPRWMAPSQLEQERRAHVRLPRRRDLGKPRDLPACSQRRPPPAASDEAGQLSTESAAAKPSRNWKRSRCEPRRQPHGSVPDHVSGAKRRGRRGGIVGHRARHQPPAPGPGGAPASEEKYRWLVANLPDVVWVADDTGRPVFVSSNCEALTGYTPEEICQPGFWMSRIHRRGSAASGGRVSGSSSRRAIRSTSNTGSCARTDNGSGCTAAR